MKKALAFFIAGIFTGALPNAIADACLGDPVSGIPVQVNSGFGKTRSLAHYGGQAHIHWGVDFQARSASNPKVGADLIAVDNGTIIGAGFWGHGYGNRVALKRSNGDIVIYSHLASIAPGLKSGGGDGVGFNASVDRELSGAPKVGTTTVAIGQKVGVAGGTSNHIDHSDGLAVHLHLEYATGYGGVRIRDMGGSSDDVKTRSKYYRDVRLYMCKTYKTMDGNPVLGTGGAAPKAVPSTVGNDPATPTSNEQADTASQTQPAVQEDERYGVPDAPPYETYAGMSESQIIEAESLRRMLDNEWETNLVKWGNRGIWIEIARMDGVLLWLDSKIEEKKSRMEGMLATMLASQVNDVYAPRMNAARSTMDRSAVIKKIQ